MVRISQIFGFGCALLTLSACGGSQPPSSSASAAPPSSASSKAPTVLRQQAARAAAAINLRSTDLPGFAATPAQPDVNPGRPNEDAPLFMCLGVGGGEQELEQRSSATFDKGKFPHVRVSSRVRVYANAAQVVGQVRAFEGPRAPKCLSDYFVASAAVDAGGARVSTGTITRLHPPNGQSDAAFGFRIAMTLTARGQHVPLTYLLYTYTKDHTDVNMTVLLVGEPVPHVDADAAFATLLARAGRAV